MRPPKNSSQIYAYGRYCNIKHSKQAMRYKIIIIIIIIIGSNKKVESVFLATRVGQSLYVHNVHMPVPPSAFVANTLISLY